MISEQIKYGIKPVAFDSPESPRKVVQPSRELLDAVQAFIDIGPRGMNSGDVMETGYSDAVQILQKLKKKPSLEELCALSVQFAPHRNISFMLGYVFSAFYNLFHDGEVITFDFDSQIPIGDIAYQLKDNKVLVNKSRLGRYVATCAKGTIINYGSMEDWASFCLHGKLLNYGVMLSNCGDGNSGLIINMGRINGDLSKDALDGIAINFGVVTSVFGRFAREENPLSINCGNVHSIDNLDGYVVAIKDPTAGFCSVGKAKKFTQAECQKMPDLIQYFDELKQRLEEGRTDANKAIEVMKSLDKEIIKEDVRRIITSYGHTW